MTTERTGTSPEFINPVEIGVYDELDPLRKVALWGEPGPETALAKLYPYQISLFLEKDESMDVMEARREMTNYTGILVDNGVSVLHVRDHLAKTLPIPNKTVAEARIDLVESGKSILETYPEEKYPEQRGKKEQFEAEVLATFNDDIAKYGERGALALAYSLSLNGNLPLGNMIYARDPMNVIGDAMIISNMKKPIRKAEVPFYRDFYRDHGIRNMHDLPQLGGYTFEGGDAYVIDKTVYIGVGSRTSPKAAIDIFKAYKNHPSMHDYKFVMVKQEQPPRDLKSYQAAQDVMHIDTWSFFFGDKHVLINPTESKRRRVILLSIDQQGKVVETDLGNYYDYLKSIGYTIHDLKDDAQKDFGANNLALDRKTVIISKSTNPDVTQTLKDNGQTVIEASLEHITRGYGGTHCVTGQLSRTL